MSNVNFRNVMDKIHPPINMICYGCPFAIWSTGVATNYERENRNQGIKYYIERSSNKYIKCYCSKMFKTTYNVCNIYDEVIINEFEYVIQCEGCEDE